MINHLSTKTLFILVLNLCLCTFLFPAPLPVSARLQRLHHQLNNNGSLGFLVIGDWGRKGWYNQSQVAVQMGIIADKLDIDFVVSTGDNFYDDGLTGVDDPAFDESFKYVYAARSLQKQWYTVLGNHDYRGDVEAQLAPKLRERDSRWRCLRSFIVTTDVAELFFVDTTPFVNMYFEDPKDHKYDWRGILPRELYLTNLVKDLRLALSESKAKWKIVVGHHGIRTTGHHCDTPELVTQLLPLLEEYEVDFYVNGHDHCLEHVSCQDSKIRFLTSGAGSKAWLEENKPHESCGVKFFHHGQGFMSMKLTKNTARFVFYDVFGKPLHRWKTSLKKLHTSI
ncbi:putative Acid phosphatase [Helianthus annuus]|nr:putative Acid phosphatase [Helianthus annuus]KAJ0454416.1 putative Acid phosphatase [Helianthus annuus]KAJ0647756.1 putative Acid phosphatase [Helianthus annuus]KAJ0651627.1 putative Acid phosphatase [Helianthus annuus]KAJ0692329.1 putative Acid phosphatase [Helianthus annuus]